jgi:predicted nucleic acid-binding protein
LDRLFLDANILFSAAYRPEAGVLKLWKLRGVELITSSYALEEARINLYEEDQRARLDHLAKSMQIVSGYSEPDLPRAIHLASKDRPILAAAIDAQATHLLTGDLTHFGRYFGRTIGGVLILPPGDYLRTRSK